MRQYVDNIPLLGSRFTRGDTMNQRTLTKLQEYRRSLITAAVTGKLNITQEETP